MKIIYFGFNALSSCLDLLIHTDDIDISCVYTGESSIHTDQIISLCEQNNIVYKSGQPTKDELNDWVVDGVSCFISAEYPYKLSIPSSLQYSINIHPTLLPEGRGQTPLPHLILSYPEHAGVTLHRLTDDLDAGDILIQKSIEIEPEETFDSLLTKVFLEAPMLLQTVISDLEHYQTQAVKQSEGSYWPTIGEDQQRIEWTMPTKTLEKICRAFGSLGVKFTLYEVDYYTTAAQCVEYDHAYEAGNVIAFDEMKLIVATYDGFIIIQRDNLFHL